MDIEPHFKDITKSYPVFGIKLWHPSATLQDVEAST